MNTSISWKSSGKNKVMKSIDKVQDIILKSNLQLDEWQIKFLLTKGDKILYCGRQIGKSVTCGHDAGYWATHNSKKVILMIAPTERQAYALFEKTLTWILDFYPNMVCKGKKRPTKTKINLTNGTIIWCLPTGISGIGIRFLTVDRLYVDEAPRIPDLVWDAVTPMLLITGGDTILLGTPFGTNNEANRTWENEDGIYDSFTRFSYSSREVLLKRKICETWPQWRLDKALKKIKREEKRMTKLVFAQEYLGKAQEGLQQVFPDELLKRILVLKRRTTILRGYNVLGMDVAGMGKDETTFEILDLNNITAIEQIEHIITKKQYTWQTSDKAIELTKTYSLKKIYIDDGGLGFGAFGDLMKENSTKRITIAINNASRLYERDSSGREIKEKKKKLMKVELYDNLLALMERDHIKLLDDNEIYQSFKSIQFEIIDGKAKYSGNYTHIAEGLIRAAWGVKTKGLKLFVS